MDTVSALLIRDEASTNATASPKDPGPVVVSSIWTMLAISSIFLALRVYCRGIRVRAMWWDDYLLITGWVRTCQWNLLTKNGSTNIELGLHLDLERTNHGAHENWLRSVLGILSAWAFDKHH